MDVDECMKERRSCRSYSTKSVPVEIVGEILEAATYAPSSGNRQNWVFIVVMDDTRKEELCMASAKQTWMLEAPVFIVVCDKKADVVEMYPDRGELYAVQNCALATQNLMLKAHSFGLGTCWVGAFDADAVSRIMKIPSDVVPEAIITLGYPSKYEKEAGRHPVDTVTFFNEYGNKKLDESMFPLKKQVKKIGNKIKDTREKGLGLLKKLKK